VSVLRCHCDIIVLICVSEPSGVFMFSMVKPSNIYCGWWACFECVRNITQVA